MTEDGVWVCQADQHAARLLAGQIFLGMVVFENEIKEVRGTMHVAA
jgi:hypothetical protein